MSFSGAIFYFACRKRGYAERGDIPSTLFEVIRHQMSPEDVITLLSFLNLPNRNSLFARIRTKHIQAEYPVDIVDMTHHLDKNRLGNMIEDFKSLNVEAPSHESESEPGNDQPEV
ncbi:hypothetical protein QL093DRAFT_2355976 [Fusarium oxysporum]|nr:hypothetical protein QL093DRAFT_2355976 [Fusarium oxysporum]